MSRLPNNTIPALIIIILTILSVSPPRSYALNSTVVLPENLDGRHIGKEVEYYVDTTHRLAIDEISSDRVSPKFTKSESIKIVNSGDRSIWLKIRVRNDSGGELEWYLENDFVFADELIFYYPGENGRFKSIAYVDTPAREREVNSVTFIFPVRTPPGETVYFLRQYHSAWTSLVPRMWSPKNLMTKLMTVDVLQGMFYGILAIMFLYNLFIFVSVREKSYFYYLLLIVGLSSIHMTLDGTGFNYVWDNLSVILRRSHSLFFYIGLIPGLLFLKAYLQTKEKTPFIDTQINALVAFGSIMIVESVILEPVSQPEYHTVILNVFILIVCLYNIAVPILYVKRGSRSAIFYLIAVFLPVLGGLFPVTFIIGLLPSFFINDFSFKLGSVGMLALFSFGLADRINTMKNELADLNANLEKKVERRTGELQQAYSKLQELDRLKTDFFANISHELRTPLTLIISPVESVLRNHTPGKVDESFLHKLYNNAGRLLSLINNLLDFSKMESGRMALHPVRTDIARQLELSVANLHSGATARGQTISFIDTTNGLTAFVDRGLFEKAVYNLLGNAMKFTPQGGRITVKLAAHDDSFTVEFNDTGIGIPADQHALIFERFSQVDSSSSRRYEGTGIGLSLTREIARLHGGDVSVESEPGKGSTFYLTIPIGSEAAADGTDMADAPGDEEERNSGTESGSCKDIIHFRSDPGSGTDPSHNQRVSLADETIPCVLLVDDNEEMLTFLSDIVSHKYRFLTAENGKTALALLKSLDDPPDIIVSDIMMPEMDGYEFTKRIREEKGYEGIPVILLTARADIAMKIEGFEKGATDYIVKPFNSSEFLARIKAQLELKSLRDRLIRTTADLYKRLEEKTGGASPISSSTEDKVAQVEEFIRSNFTADLSREGMAAAVGISADHLSRAFNQITGKRIDEYINGLRVEKAKQMLEETHDTITRIAFNVGFENLRTFNKTFLKLAGMTPSEWRRSRPARK